jgi:hypothetical protein
MTTVFPLHREFLVSRSEDFSTAKRLRAAAVEYLQRLENGPLDPVPTEESLELFNLVPETIRSEAPGVQGAEEGSFDQATGIFEREVINSIDGTAQFLPNSWDHSSWNG